MRWRKIGAWSVHFYTALGLPLALGSLIAASNLAFKEALLLLALTTFIDATDGALARHFEVKKYAAQIDGALLDNITDYITYVLAPLFLAWMAGMLPFGYLGWLVASLPLVASGFGFSHLNAKTSDHFFTGFPSYWNIVIYYLYLLQSPVWLNSVILVFLAIMVFVPIRYLYPSRSTVARIPTLVLGVFWMLAVFYSLIELPEVSKTLVYASLLFPTYYFVVSLIAHFRMQGSRSVA